MWHKRNTKFINTMTFIYVILVARGVVAASGRGHVPGAAENGQQMALVCSRYESVQKCRWPQIGAWGQSSRSLTQLTLSERTFSLSLSFFLYVCLSLSLSPPLSGTFSRTLFGACRWSNFPSLVTGSQQSEAKFLINLTLQTGGGAGKFSVCILVGQSVCVSWILEQKDSGWLPKRNWANRKDKLVTKVEEMDRERVVEIGILIILYLFWVILW